MMLQFFANGQRWQLIHDPEFVAGKKLKKKALEDRLKQMEGLFLSALKEAATMYRWPLAEHDNPSDLRILGDEPSSTVWRDALPL